MGNQGIVYEQNLWHSPMCAIDKVQVGVRVSANQLQTVEFAVVQNENGVAEEDTVEYFLNADERVDIILLEPRSRL